MTKLKATKVNFSANGKKILSNINLDIAEQEFTVLIGPNGSGKSSLLKLLAGTEKPTGGKVELNGRQIKDYSKQDLSSIRAVLSQSIHLGFPIANHEVVKMGFLNSPDKQTANRLLQTSLAHTDATDLAEQYYDRCSGGEKTLIQMSRILVQLWTSALFPHQILFLDEPTAALDLRYQLQILKLCKELCDQGMSVFCILHDLQLAAHFADNIIVMNNGMIAEQGAPDMILRKSLTNHIFQVDSHAFIHPKNQKPMLVADP